jgi:hypothetical protein
MGSPVFQIVLVVLATALLTLFVLSPFLVAIGH